MDAQIIHKSQASVAPWLASWEKTRAGFDWQGARALLDGLPGGAGLNIAHEAVTRHARSAHASKTALRWLGKNGVRDFSYLELEHASARFANALGELGVRPGERVFVLLGRVPELHVAMLGALRAKCVVCPLSSALGPEPIAARLALGDARVLVTTPKLYEQKVRGVRDRLPGLRHVLLTGNGHDTEQRDTHDFVGLLAAASQLHEIPPTAPEEPALLHFTSGTAGAPRGALHVHEAVVMHHVTGRFVLDLHDDDVFWCTADPGWVTGTAYGVLAPLTNGVTMVVDEADLDAERCYQVLEQERVSVWCTAPAAIRMLMKANPELPRRRDLSKLRFLASVGEPLNPEAVLWSQAVFGRPFHDNWWQTEAGGIMLANYASMDVKPGSIGKPLPGVTAAIVRRIGSNKVEVLARANEEGELALRPGWPSMFRAYLDAAERYEKCFVDGWYLSGDLARRDADGYFWLIGRADDANKSSGHLVDPFEVESTLLEHPAVAAAGVVGKPAPAAGKVANVFSTSTRTCGKAWIRRTSSTS